MVNGVCRRPNDIVVAILANSRCSNVGRVLAGCADAIVAAAAIVEDAGMVEVGWYPAEGRMAVVAIIAAGNVSGVLTARNQAVVTRSTASQDLCMVHDVDRSPGDTVMTFLASVGRQNVGLTLTSRLGTVVTAGAVVEDVGVIKGCWDPCVSRMTIVASIAGLNVGWVLARGCRAVVAGPAGSKHLQVLDLYYRLPEVRAVAIFADVGGQNVGGAFSCCLDAVVAAEAIVGDIGVVEYGRYPRRRIVTIVALIA